MLNALIRNAERSTKFQLPFATTSLFPSISIDEILEVEFQLGLELHIPYFNDMDYFEFIWKYERLNKYKVEKSGKGKTSFTEYMNAPKS